MGALGNLGNLGGPCGLVLALFGCASEPFSTPSNDVCNPPDISSYYVFVSELRDPVMCLHSPRHGVEDGRFDCPLLKVSFAPCSCDPSAGLRVATLALDRSVRLQLREENDGEPSGTTCQERCVCELMQLVGAKREACRSDPDVRGPPGFCYVDPSAGFGTEAVGAACPLSEYRRLRILDPAPDASDRWFVSCLGAN